MKRTILTFIILLITLAACRSPNTSTPASPTTTSKPTRVPTRGPIGTLKLEENRVEHGSDANTLKQVLADISFFANDFVRVSDGGEALLDCGDKMRMRLFNDTEMEMVYAKTAPNVPWDVRFYLYRGGFTGKLTKEGGKAAYETPGGAEITVLGTDFFVIYDPVGGVTIAGNFSGSVQVVSGGDTVMVPDGFYVTMPDNQPPNPPQPLPLSQTEFEQEARDVQSPIQAANEAGEWLLEMSWEWLAFPDFERVLTAITWSGEFHIEGDRIIGEGTGTIAAPPPGEDDLITVAGGTFQFDIVGVVHMVELGSSVFEFEIQGRNSSIELEELRCNDPETERFCEDNKLLVTGILHIMAEELPTITAPIAIDAENEATTIAELDGSQVTYPTVFDEEQMIGFDFQAPFIDVFITSASMRSN